MKKIKRHAEAVLRRYAREFPAVLVTGARQTGKSTLLGMVTAAKSVPSLTFDDPVEEMSARSDPKSFMAFHSAPHLFDEVQYVPELFRYLKIAIDSDRRPGMFYLTGSQPFHLTQAAAESLSGRVGVLHLAPLSRREIAGESFTEPFVPSGEYLSRRKTATRMSDIWNVIFQGGYPEVVTGAVTPRDFYFNYIRTYIERDIKSLTQVADEMQFMQFVTVAAARTGQLVNYADMAREVGVSEVTAKKWLSLLVSSGLVFLLKPFASNIEKRVVKTPKLYFLDTGLAAALTRWSSPDILRNGAMAGAFFETYAVSEAVKSFYNAGIEPPLYFYRDKDKMEIDLLVVSDQTIYPVEIKKTATPGPADAANFHVLSRIKGLKISRPLVVCATDKPAAITSSALAIPCYWL